MVSCCHHAAIVHARAFACIMFPLICMNFCCFCRLSKWLTWRSSARCLWFPSATSFHGCSRWNVHRLHAVSCWSSVLAVIVLLWWDTQYAFIFHVVRIYTLIKNTQGGANYHVVHGAGKAANQARIRSPGQFMLQFYCILTNMFCCNDWAKSCCLANPSCYSSTQSFGGFLFAMRLFLCL